MKEKKSRRTRKSSVADQVKKRNRGRKKETENILDPGPDPSSITEDRLIPSGSTLLNCACSDNPFGAFGLGTINTIPGSSASGKTILVLSMLASCAADKRFDNYQLVMDDSEQAMGFDLDYLFPPLVDRLEFPNIDDETEDPLPSETIQDFMATLILKCKEDKPFIYVLDSLDSLTSREELEKEYKQAIAMAKSDAAVKELKGSYRMDKAKHIGEALRMINGYIKHSNSALFIIQQTRQRINPGYGQAHWTTSGGNAPFFYSFHQVYMNQTSQIKEKAMGLNHRIGGIAQIEIVKNKLTGKRRRDGLTFPIYEDLGIDDVASCVDFLKLTDHWKSDKGGIIAEEFDIKKTRNKLVFYIEENRLETDLQKIVGGVWNKIESELRLNRRRRF